MNSFSVGSLYSCQQSLHGGKGEEKGFWGQCEPQRVSGRREPQRVVATESGGRRES